MNLQNNCYLPIPPRAWSRVQNSCSLTTNTTNSIPIGLLGEKNAMLNKGNVLQYKANSSNLTQAQKYSKIAQGNWTNRNTTWATQSSRGYTNPNTTSLKRSGNVTNVAIDPITGAIIGPTTAPVTCPTFITTINEGLPSNIEAGGSTDEPEIPPSIPPTPASETFPPIIGDTPIEPIVIQDEGVLICSIHENVCTGETKSSISQQLCHPTSDSDVPGTLQLLCWNDGTPTWYPRSRYIMTNSANKWPTNAVLFSAVRPPTPQLNATLDNCVINLIWTTNIRIGCNCLFITAYNIYINGELYQTVSADTNSASLFIPKGSYIIYITSLSQNIESIQSNIIDILSINEKIIVVGLSNIKLTPFLNGAKIETTIVPSTSARGYGEAFLVLCGATTVNGLIVGGGGGGASGYFDTTGGAGGGGGAINFFQTYNPPVNSIINLRVGSGGSGGPSTIYYAGNAGYESYISDQNGSILCGYGDAGFGLNTTRNGGGAGGSATKNGTIGLTLQGYGGGGGGGASTSDVPPGLVSAGGLGGTGISPGITGTSGTGSDVYIPGNGGASGLTSYNIPNYGTVNLGGGGGGGGIGASNKFGGLAGNGTGGGGGLNNSNNGQNATNFGGGGGGGCALDIYNNGGSGANGVIFLWT